VRRREEMRVFRDDDGGDGGIRVVVIQTGRR